MVDADLYILEIAHKYVQSKPLEAQVAAGNEMHGSASRQCTHQQNSCVLA